MKRIVLSICVIIQLHAASSSSDSELTVLAVPGQNGLGSSREYVASQLGIAQDRVHSVSTPDMLLKIDFGQRFCQRRLDEAYQLHASGRDYGIHATSQGTGTTLNERQVIH